MKLVINLSFKKRKIDNAKNPDMKEIYRDNRGNRYYCNREAVKIPGKRLIAIEKTTRYAGLAITEETLKQLTDKMIDSGNKNDWVTLFSIVKEIQFRLNLIAEEDTMLDMAALLYYDRYEDPQIIDKVLLSEKKERMKSDSDALDFFLLMVKKSTDQYNEISDEEILKYLAATKKYADRINNYLPS